MELDKKKVLFMTTIEELDERFQTIMRSRVPFTLADRRKLSATKPHRAPVAQQRDHAPTPWYPVRLHPIAFQIEVTLLKDANGTIIAEHEPVIYSDLWATYTGAGWHPVRCSTNQQSKPRYHYCSLDTLSDDEWRRIGIAASARDADALYAELTVVINTAIKEAEESQ